MTINELIKKALRVKIGKNFKYAIELKELGLELINEGWSQQGYYSVQTNSEFLKKTLVISTDYSKRSRLFNPYSPVYGAKGSIKEDLNNDLSKYLNV